MPKILSLVQIEQYRRDGFAFPVPVLDLGEVHELRAVHHPKVLDAVEDLIGPDILVYHSTMWIKKPHTPRPCACSACARTRGSRSRRSGRDQPIIVSM